MVDWQQQGLERVRQTILKQYNAEVHSQSALEGILTLTASRQMRPEAIERVEIDIFDVAYHIIGGGEEGDKRQVRTKEEADHSLPYMAAVALLDGEVTPAQYAPERILRGDVQSLLRKVVVRPDEELSERFPQEMPCRIRLFLTDGQALSVEQHDYEGFYTRPMSWETAAAKFARLAAPFTDESLRQSLEEMVKYLEAVKIGQLTELLAEVRNTQ